MTANPVMYCTGRGTHEWQHAESIDKPLHPERRDSVSAAMNTWWRCPQCRRELRLGQRNRELLFTAGLDAVDISLLPF